MSNPDNKRKFVLRNRICGGLCVSGGALVVIGGIGVLFSPDPHRLLYGIGIVLYGFFDVAFGRWLWRRPANLPEGNR